MSTKVEFPYGEAISRAFSDSQFLELLLDNPEKALNETGVNLDPGVVVKASMTGNSAGGALNIDVKNAAVNWIGSVNLTLHK